MDRAFLLNSQVQRSSGSLTLPHRSPLSGAQLGGSPHARSASPQPRSRVNSFVASAPATTAPTPPWMEVGLRANSSAAVVSPTAPAAPTLGKDLRWPTNFKKEYLLGKCIGSGAFGTVHLAIHRATGQQVAVKIMSKTRAKQTRDKTVAKLQREVDQLNSLARCEHVVKLQGKFEDDGFAYLVMEHCGGGDLDQLIQAIAVCHDANTVHGDIKPANFLLKNSLKKGATTAIEQAAGSGAWVKAIDFGCSQVVHPDKPLTRRAGTPVYMAPEVFRREYGVQSDMWSLGMMLYHFVSQRFPFWESMDECRSSTLDDVMRAVTMESIPFDFGPFLNMSPEGIDMLKGLLQRDPAKRMTARQAINHPWFKLHAAYEETSKENGLQGPVSINVMAGIGGVLSSNIQGNASLPREASTPRQISQQRGVLKTLV
ncbi:hypothetical protein ABBQ38_010674 [Trebouxia sp. C0009 RCD-2024]